MAYVWFGVIALGERHCIPYGTRGRVIRHGPVRTLVDFGEMGRWRVPNVWLRATCPEKEQTARMRRMAGPFGGAFGKGIIGILAGRKEE